METNGADVSGTYSSARRGNRRASHCASLRARRPVAALSRGALACGVRRVGWRPPSEARVEDRRASGGTLRDHADDGRRWLGKSSRRSNRCARRRCARRACSACVARASRVRPERVARTLDSVCSRSPIRPVLKHGPRSLRCARVIGCAKPKGAMKVSRASGCDASGARLGARRAASPHDEYSYCCGG